MHEETALGWPAPPLGSGLASNKATYSSAKMDEEGVPMERQTHGGMGQIQERKRREKIRTKKNLRNGPRHQRRKPKIRKREGRKERMRDGDAGEGHSPRGRDRKKEKET